MAQSKDSLSQNRERFFKETPGITSGVTILKPRQKYVIIRSLDISATVLCSIAGVSASGYYKWLKTVDEEDIDHDDYLLIQAKFTKGKSKWGARTIKMKLEEDTVYMNLKKVRRIMKKYSCNTKIRRTDPYKAIMKKTQEHRTHENLLDRQFDQDTPSRVHCTDITYVPFQGTFVYLSPIKDIASREIVAWNLSQHIDMNLVMNMLEKLTQNGTIPSLTNSIIHSDQGAHYTSPQYANRINDLGMIQSMSRKGNCIDNAPMESFFGHFKDEIDYSDCNTFEELKQRIAEYMHYYNNNRPQWALNKMTPVQYRSHLLTT